MWFKSCRTVSYLNIKSLESNWVYFSSIILYCPDLVLILDIGLISDKKRMSGSVGLL